MHRRELGKFRGHTVVEYCDPQGERDLWSINQEISFKYSRNRGKGKKSPIIKMSDDETALSLDYLRKQPTELGELNRQMLEDYCSTEFFISIINRWVDATDRQLSFYCKTAGDDINYVRVTLFLIVKAVAYIQANVVNRTDREFDKFFKEMEGWEDFTGRVYFTIKLVYKWMNEILATRDLQQLLDMIKRFKNIFPAVTAIHRQLFDRQDGWFLEIEKFAEGYKQKRSEKVAKHRAKKEEDK